MWLTSGGILMTIQRKVGIRVVLLFTLALLALQLPGMGLTKAFAADKSITGLGTGSIQNPVNGNTDGLTAWTGSYVYYGKYIGKPVKYRVLTTRSSDFGGNTMLLDCNYVLLKREFDEGNSIVWETSSLRAFLNGTGFYSNQDVFTAAEKSAIAASTKNQKNGNDGSGAYYLGFAPLSGDHIFLLDAVEASCTAYGYEDFGNSGSRYNGDQKADTRKKGAITYPSAWEWWLRSPTLIPGRVEEGYVSSNGLLCDIDIADQTLPVSPAMNVSLSSILFSSAISSEPGSYTLTIKDKNLNIKVADGKSATKNGSSITVPYTISGSSKTNSTKACVLITDKPYAESGARILQHTELTSGTGSFTLSNNITGTWGKDYHVYLLAENINGIYETDYASEPVELVELHIHNFSYSASGAKITAKCSGQGNCSEEAGSTLTINAPADLTYDGRAKAATLGSGYSTTAFPGTYPIEYYQGSTKLSSAPVNVGTYTAKVTVEGATASVTYTIKELSTEQGEQNIISDSGEKDEAGSTFYPLCARQKKVKKNSITFTWNKVKGANSYVVYGFLCGTHKSQKLTTTTATSYTWKKLKKGTYYKIYVVAKNGADVISISKKVHVATSGKSYGNVTSVSVKKKSVKLKKGKTFKLGASFKKKGKIRQHRRLSYESTNPAVATVNSSGKIKAVGKGTCYIYAYTQNGLFKRVKVTVKK